MPIVPIKIQRIDNHQNYSSEDKVATEVPVALVYNGISHAVMMCTPQDLEDFALGFSLSEQIIDSPQQIYGIDIKHFWQSEKMTHGIELQIELSSRQFMRLKEHRRSLVGRTGCGICGSEQLQQVYKNLAKIHRTFSLDYQLLPNCLQQLQQQQRLNQQTGALHAAAFFTPQGELLALREDIGRHVALDKLLGWYAKQQKPLGFIIVTSRASYEMVQKCISQGIEALIAISAATSLAIDMAQQHNLTLIGFARAEKAVVYCE